ncbi:hypothetical protein Bbelb_282390 [Branchiostoma belcheri]|nr:hypothetical protein Bbelb_282390 [Branchiostoma belcheri]
MAVRNAYKGGPMNTIDISILMMQVPQDRTAKPRPMLQRLMHRKLRSEFLSARRGTFPVWPSRPLTRDEYVTVFGIKGPSWLNWVPKFDLIKGNSIDYMHGTLLGVTKALMMLWFGSANKNAPYYCGHHLCDIDNILLAIRPPMDIHRTPRGIDDHLRHWKASEYRSWLLFYSLPIMHLFLPNDYFQNYLLLVNAIHILLGEVISQDEINKAEDLLQQFVEGSKLVSLNVHNLCHYAQTVRELGPLWCHSCFSFEDVNGQLLKLIHGTQGVEEQGSYTRYPQNYLVVDQAVLRAVAILQKFSEVGDACFIPGTASKKLYDSLNNVTVPPEERSNFTEIGPGFYSVGSLKEESCKADGTYSTIKPSHMEAVMARLDFLPESLMIYQRMMKNGEMVHSRLYSRAVRHNSYTIEYTTDENSCFGEVLYFIQVTTRTCGCGIAKRASCDLFLHPPFLPGEWQNSIVFFFIRESNVACCIYGDEMSC